jgi:hypothetical protein
LALEVDLALEVISNDINSSLWPCVFARCIPFGKEGEHLQPAILVFQTLLGVCLLEFTWWSCIWGAICKDIETQEGLLCLQSSISTLGVTGRTEFYSTYSTYRHTIFVMMYVYFNTAYQTTYLHYYFYILFIYIV